MSLMTVADFGHKRSWMIMESVDDRGIHRALQLTTNKKTERTDVSVCLCV